MADTHAQERLAELERTYHADMAMTEIESWILSIDNFLNNSHKGYFTGDTSTTEQLLEVLVVLRRAKKGG